MIPQKTPWSPRAMQKNINQAQREHTILNPEIIRSLESVFSRLPDDPQSNIDFQQKIASALKENIPNIENIIEDILNLTLRGNRFVILRNVGFENFSKETVKLFILGFCSLLGTPTPTDLQSKTIIWPVQPEKNPKVAQLTHSQNTKEADLHTDTTFFENPEKIMSLWCLHPDKNDMGKSRLLDSRFVLNKMMESQKGREMCNILQQDFPFRVPSIFTEEASDECVQVLQAPIIGKNPYFRYRIDAIRKGFECLGITPATVIQNTLSYLRNQLSLNGFLEFSLKKGDVLIANNHELLHGRGRFQDLERLLYRVRMHPYEHETEV